MCTPLPRPLAPQQVGDRLAADSTLNKVTNPGTGSANRPLSVNTTPGGNQPPVANFTHNCGTSSLTCTFDASGSSDPDGTIASYAWNFGDGTSGGGATVTHTFAVAGTYTVTLTVTDNQGAASSTSQSVAVGAPPANQPPIAAFTASCTSFLGIIRWCTFNSSASTDPDGTITARSWNFGDGTTGTGTSVTHFYNTAGAKTVTLTVTDNGGAIDTETKTVNVP